MGLYRYTHFKDCDPVLHSINLDLLRASTCHHPDGCLKDPHEAHRRDHILVRRAARRLAIRALLHKVLQTLRRSNISHPAPYSATSTVAQVSKQTPPANAITPIVARPPKPRSRPNTSTSRSDSPDDTLCTSS